MEYHNLQVMAWGNKRILMHVVAVGMLGSMTSVGYGSVDTDDRSTWIKILEKGNSKELQRIIPKIPESSGLKPLVLWATYRAGICGKTKFGGMVGKLIAAGVDPDERDDFNFSALHDAAVYGCFRIMKQLLELGLDPNGQARDGITPLHYAALFGHLGVFRLLLNTVPIQIYKTMMAKYR
jgi:hypothetical protein